VAYAPGVTEKEINAVVMGEGYAEVRAYNGEFAFGLIEGVPWRSLPVPAFTIIFAGELNHLSGAMSAQGMPFEYREAVSPDPSLPDGIVRMPVMNDGATVLVDKNFKSGIIYRAETGLDDPAEPRARLGDEWTPDPWSGDVASVLEEVPQLYSTVFEMEGHYYIESTALAGAEGGLDDAARTGHVIQWARDALPAYPRRMHGHGQSLTQRRG
jgi:hypothetical protein